MLFEFLRETSKENNAQVILTLEQNGTEQINKMEWNQMAINSIIEWNGWNAATKNGTD